jgi:hypothetical protein
MIKAAAAVFAGNENDPRSLLFFLFIPVCDFRGAAPLLHVGRYLGVEDFVRIGRRLAALELIDHIHPANDLADHGVLAVEKRAVGDMMKNWLLAEFGSLVRAMPTTPRV